jgi:hypothetical protein
LVTPFNAICNFCISDAYIAASLAKLTPPATASTVPPIAAPATAPAGPPVKAPILAPVAAPAGKNLEAVDPNAAPAAALPPTPNPLKLKPFFAVVLKDCNFFF